MSYLVRIVEDGSLPDEHHWAVAQEGDNGHPGHTVALIEKSWLSPRTLSQCWVAAQRLLPGEDR